MEFKLRDWELKDAESIVPYANNQKVAENLRDTFPFPYTLDDAHLFIMKSKNQHSNRQYNKAIVVDDLAVGSVSIAIQDDVSCKSGELGFWLGESFWGKGIATRAIKQVCEDGFSNFDIIRLYARPFAGNLSARKVLERADFQLEGICRKSIYKNGNTQDSCIYALIK